MRQVLIAMLATVIALLVSLATFFAISSVLHSIRIALGCQENGFFVWVLCLYVLLCWRIQGRVWQMGLACAACNLMAYLAFKMHREDLRQAFDSLGDLIILISMFSGRGWGRKLGNKLKSMSLTAINAASFKRQSAEVLSCRV